MPSKESRGILSPHERDILEFEENYLGGFPSARIVSEALGLSTRQVELARKREAYLNARAELAKSSIQILRENKKKAARKLVKLLNSKDERVALRACESILGNDLTAPLQEVRHSIQDLAEPMTMEEATDILSKTLGNA